MINKTVPSSSSSGGGSSGSSGLPPPSKKRKADQLSPDELRTEINALRRLAAAVDANQLKTHVLKQFDDVLATLDNIHSNPPPPPSIVSSQQPSVSGNRTRHGNTTPPPEPAHTARAIDANISVINALTLIFSNLYLRTPTHTASASSSPSRSLVAPTSVGSSSNTMPPSSVSSSHAQPIRPEAEGPELHCVRCHQDFDPSTNEEGDCAIEHYMEDCKRIAKNGQSSSRWRYSCCGYEFDSQYSDEPEDEEADTNQGQYCFVGRHTTDERVAYSRKMNTYSCDEAGCWEEEGAESNDIMQS